MPPEASAPPLFCHVHIPKTGGTSLHVLLSRWFPGAFEVIHHPDPHFVISPEALEDRLEQSPNLLCIATHHLRTFRDRIGNRKVYYFTFLRDPLDRTISTITFMKKFSRDFSEEHRRSMPPSFEQMSELQILRQWTADPLTSDDLGQLRGNPVTAMFLNGTSSCHLGNNRHAHELAHAAKCISILNRFLYVGDFACFEQSVAELAHHIRKLGVSACELDDVPMERLSRDIRGDLRWLDDGWPIVNAYMDQQRVDGLVYRHFAYANNLSTKKRNARCHDGR